MCLVLVSNSRLVVSTIFFIFIRLFGGRSYFDYIHIIFQLGWFNHELARSLFFWCSPGFFRFVAEMSATGCQWPAMALSRSLGASIASTCGVSSEPEAVQIRVVIGIHPSAPWRMGCQDLVQWLVKSHGWKGSHKPT